MGTAAWNQVSNTADFSTDGSTAASPAAAPASPQGQAVPSSLPLNYYVRFTLADGDVVSVNGGQLFALEGFSFSEQNSLSIGSQSGGAGAGKATFNPLQLTFSQLGLQPVMLQALATGSHFKEVDVLGYSQANQLVTDDSFGLVLASNLGVDSSGATQVSLEYGSQEIQQSTQLANGSLSPPVTASWNQVSNTADFSTDGSTAASPAAAPASPQGQAVPSSLPLDYYVRFTLADGDAVTVNGGQLFALEGFSFSEQDSVSIGGQSGSAGAGKATLNPLQLTFSQLGLQSVLLQALTTGSHFKEVDVLGYSQANQLVTDDSFGLVLASNLGADSTGATQVSLEYGSQEIQQSTQLANGSLSPPVIASWNQVSNAPDFSTDGSTAASPVVAPASPQGQAVSSSLPLDYYVRFTLADGDAVTVNGGQLFALEGFSFSEQDSVSIGGQSGGGGAGKATFNPLQLTFSQLGLQPALLTALATGSHFQEVDVLGYSKANHLVTDDSFGLVLASNLGVDSSGATQVSLEYGSQEIQQSTQLDQLLPQPNFNGDNFSDLLWQNANGQASIWEMNGNTLIGGGAVSPNPGPAWQAVGTGDFNGEGPSDILFQNTGSGEASIWDMNGNTLTGGGPVTPNPGPSWKAIGTGDFNNDGDSDILFQNASSGQVSIWEMNGSALIGGGPVSPNPGLAWKAVGTGDFNDDGFSDILFQNTSTGQVSIWEMNGNKLIGGGPVTPNPGPSWKAIGTGDFNGDGLSDILFQNTSSGQVSVWEMNGNSLVGGGPVSPNPGPSWHAIGTGDFNGDGFSDILFQNASGQASVWEMNGASLIGGGTVSPNPGSSWRAVA